MNKKMLNMFLLLIFAVLISFTGCKKDDSNPVNTDTINEAELLVKHFEQNNDYIHGASFVIGAPDVRTNILTNPAKQLIVDIRAAADFNNKRLKGAVNKTLAELPAYFKTLTMANYDKVVIACYSGQTSAYAVSLIRALGYGSKVVSLKWGMSSIDSSFAQNYWLSKMLSPRVADFVTTDSPAKNPAGSLPTLSTGKKTAPEILEERVNALITAGYSAATVNEATLYSNLSGYYIVNYWTNALYKDPGHINGAINYDPTAQPFKLANDLKTLPTNKPVVLYCFTGQTSSYVGAYLRLLGYDAKSLLYGANSMIYNLMVTKNVANTFIPATEIKGYTDILEP